ncbi:2OG-Fe(II) oxygenase [Undibacterium sp. JH2W]|uniref:2OG-Fe(II) oxygenase n=1 Tax=Undibacterium sp. JH2W TaxID=3413037 RepID=UPI003BF0DC31
MDTKKSEQSAGQFASRILDVFDDPHYAQLAFDNKDVFQKNDPFPHIVFDNFLPDSVAEQLANEYPKLDEQDINFKFHHHQNASRHFLEDTRSFSQNFKLFSSAISSRSFLLFLETLTGTKSLIPDPYFMGGGAMMTGNGGFLNVHVDFNWHQKLQAWRRCNALFYLTPDWKEEYGGNLELWSQDGSHKVKEVPPVFNRLVVFNTTSKSYHGQPGKITTPDGIHRKVFSAFYYASERNEEIDSSPHFTKYNGPDMRENNTAEFETSPYSEGITRDYLKNVK